MDRRRFLPTYHYEDNTDGVLVGSVGKPLRDYKIYGNSEQNGTPSPEAPVEIMSVGEKTDDGRYKIPIKVIGKNLYDAETHFNAIYEAETLKLNGYEPTKGVVDGIECYQYWGRNFSLTYPENVLYIKGIFKENTQYTISLDRYDIFASNGYPGVNLQVYYTDGTYKHASVITVGVGLEKTWRHDTFTSAVNKTIKHIYFGFSTGGAQTYFANMQIEEGTTETAYEPYKDLGTTNIYLAEPLRKVDGYADYVDFKNGKVVRALDCLTLDGTEKWLSTDKIVYMTWGTVDNYTYINGETLSTHLRNYATREDGEMYFEPVSTVLRVYKMNGTYTDVEGWKTFLAEEYAKGNPVQLITPFATPKEEPIELPTIPTAKGIVNIMVDTDVQPSGAVWQYYRE